MTSDTRRPISREEAQNIVGGEDGGGGHSHDPCTYPNCNCKCSNGSCGGCTCNSQLAVGDHPHM